MCVESWSFILFCAPFITSHHFQNQTFKWLKTRCFPIKLKHLSKFRFSGSSQWAFAQRERESSLINDCFVYSFLFLIHHIQVITTHVYSPRGVPTDKNPIKRVLGWGSSYGNVWEPLSVSLIVKLVGVGKLKGWAVPQEKKKKKPYSCGALTCMRLSCFLANREKVLGSISGRPGRVQYRCPRMTTEQKKDKRKGVLQHEYGRWGSDDLESLTWFYGTYVDVTEETSLWDI